MSLSVDAWGVSFNGNFLLLLRNVCVFFLGQFRMSGFVSSTLYLDLIVAVQVFFSYVTCVSGCW